MTRFSFDDIETEQDFVSLVLIADRLPIHIFISMFFIYFVTIKPVAKGQLGRGNQHRQNNLGYIGPTAILICLLKPQMNLSMGPSYWVITSHSD